ncbi:sensor histidine kinase [Undibacter mobilis]|uniref:histidine kinase n=1 Tax=Undibacter mobilis TaxID=2292256 RepID=A0A371B3K9_9BRAD|nr:PAS domain-containing sensor histidine kinase [Undibacter mobilis]RDV02176.1 PAS domain S-box protein [Undibacter mobilis]
MSLLTPLWQYVDALVYPAARQDALTAARHRAFIAPRLIGSFVALASFPVFIAFRGVPSALELGVFAWLVAPILIAYFLSRTGRYEAAHVLSSLALTGLVTAVALFNGGIASFAAIWLVVVPLEASLSASRRVVALASIFALSAAGLMLLANAYNLLPPAASASEPGALAALGVVSAALYATGLALGAEQLARTSVWLRYAEEDRYRLLARNMTDVIARHDRNGAVLFISPAAETLFGTPSGALIGHGLFDHVHVADRPAFLTALADASAHGDDRSVEFRIRRGGDVNQGTRFIWVEMRCRPLDEANETPAAEREVVAVMRDISERKVHEQAMEMARAEQERASLSKSRFLATMSHELRTPLNAIIGFSEMLTRQDLVVQPERQIEYARLINESGHHLLSVVNGILDMSKMETGNFEITPEPFAPAPVVTGCCDLLALKARDAGVEIRAKLAVDLPEIVGDRRAFNQILINLVSNAIKFTPRGGSVTISAQRDGTNIAVAVEDTGVGIGEADLPRLGEAFFQARGTYDRRHDGTGLGLSIVKGLVKLHNGDIEIRSRLGEGTRVTVRLPIDCEGHRTPADPIRLVTERAGDLATAAKVLVKKSA